MNISIYAYLWFWFWITLPMFIYFDATKHKIGTNKGEKVTWSSNVSAGYWAGMVVVPLLIVRLSVIIAYLVKRRSLCEKAEIYPVTLSKSHKALCYVLLLVTGLLTTYWSMVFVEAHSEAQEIANKAAFMKLTGLSLFN